MPLPPNLPISGLPVAGPLDGTEKVPILQGGVTKSVTSDKLKATAVNDGIVFILGGALLADPLIIVSGSGSIDMSQGRLTAHQVVADELYFSNLTGAGVVQAVSGQLVANAGVSVLGGNTLQAQFLSALSTVSIAGGLAFIDQFGSVSGSELHAANGFTGSGTFTNFTIVDGIIRSAS